MRVKPDGVSGERDYRIQSECEGLGVRDIGAVGLCKRGVGVSTRRSVVGCLAAGEAASSATVCWFSQAQMSLVNTDRDGRIRGETK
jgi:hypothetical protein